MGRPLFRRPLAIDTQHVRVLRETHCRVVFFCLFVCVFVCVCWLALAWPLAFGFGVFVRFLLDCLLDGSSIFRFWRRWRNQKYTMTQPILFTLLDTWRHQKFIFRLVPFFGFVILCFARYWVCFGSSIIIIIIIIIIKRKEKKKEKKGQTCLDEPKKLLFFLFKEPLLPSTSLSVCSVEPMDRNFTREGETYHVNGLTPSSCWQDHFEKRLRNTMIHHFFLLFFVLLSLSLFLSSSQTVCSLTAT